MYPSAHGTWRRLLLTLPAVFSLCLGSAQAQNGEYSAKASRIFTFARYVRWPERKMRPDSPFVIGVIGQDNISDMIREQVGGRTLKDRTVVVKSLAAVQEIAGCHILFVSRSEDPRLGSILRMARGNSVLTVGESDAFEKEGGCLRLFFDGSSMRFVANKRNLDRADLEPDLGLLQMAQKVNDR
jgi:hypothetical protein